MTADKFATAVRDDYTDAKVSVVHFDDESFMLLTYVDPIGGYPFYELFRAEPEYADYGNPESGPKLSATVGDWYQVTGGMGVETIESAVHRYWHEKQQAGEPISPEPPTDSVEAYLADHTPTDIPPRTTVVFVEYYTKDPQTGEGGANIEVAFVIVPSQQTERAESDLAREFIKGRPYFDTIIQCHPWAGEPQNGYPIYDITDPLVVAGGVTGEIPF